jgi:putative glutamine amidotransferase
MRPRIAIPVPHSDEDYALRSLPQYERAIELAGGEPVRIPLEAARAREWIEPCHGLVLPGSKADVEPAKYGLPRHPKTALADIDRDRMDHILLDDAYNRRKPVLGICYGLQTLIVYRGGTLIQHIESRVNHSAGRNLAVAHTVEIEPQSKLSEILAAGLESPAAAQARKRAAAVEQDRGDHQPEKTAADWRAHRGKLIIPVNSSHHQSADRVGEGLRIVARCPDDGIVEALEGNASDHFVLAVQWHPERSRDEDRASEALFRALVSAARNKQAELAGQPV